MEKTTIINIETGISKKCDILFKNKNILEVVIEDTTIKITLIKKKPLEQYYNGKYLNMDFQSSGK
tara:strand:- start:112 stop:306 length:195 start_codon:yes stop_codon:yes gene_type:complete